MPILMYKLPSYVVARTETPLEKEKLSQVCIQEHKLFLPNHISSHHTRTTTQPHECTTTNSAASSTLYSLIPHTHPTHPLVLTRSISLQCLASNIQPSPQPPLTSRQLPRPVYSPLCISDILIQTSPFEQHASHCSALPRQRCAIGYPGLQLSRNSRMTRRATDNHQAPRTCGARGARGAERPAIRPEYWPTSWKEQAMVPAHELIHFDRHRRMSGSPSKDVK